MLRARLTALLCLLLLSTFPVRPAVNAWSPLGPEGGSIHQIAVDPSNASIVFAATMAGGFRSTDGGSSWTKVFFLECADIVVHPTNSSIVFLVNRSREIFKSTDGGATFSPSHAGIASLTQGSLFGRLAFKPGDPTVLYYAWPRGVFKSVDGGVNWTASDSGSVNNQSVRDLLVDPANPDVVYLHLTAKGVWKSVDSAATWNAANTGLPTSGTATPPNVNLTGLAMDPSNTQTLLAYSSLFSDQRVYVSTNGGGSWTVRSGNLPLVHSLFIVPGTSGMTVFADRATIAGSDHALMKSVDGGATFTAVATSLPSTFQTMIFERDPSNAATWYATIGEGLAKTTDSGATWTAVNQGLATQEVGYAFSFAPSAPSTWYAPMTAGIYKTTDAGATFAAVNGVLTQTNVGVIGVDPSNPDLLIAGASVPASDGYENAQLLVRSTDGGSTWNAIPNPLYPDSELGLQPWGIAAFPTTPTTFFVLGASEGVYKSIDAGATFSPVNTGLPITNNFLFAGLALGAADSTGTVLYAPFSKGLYKTTDGGTSWSLAGSGLPTTMSGEVEVPASVRTVAVHPGTPDRVMASAASRLYRSLDAGATWDPVPTSFYGEPFTIAIDPGDPSKIYAAGTAVAGTSRIPWIVRSVDGGGTWHQVPTEGLDLLFIATLAVDPLDPNRLIAGGRGGLREATFAFSDCIQSVTPGSANFSGTGGTGSLTVTAPGGCAWTAATPAGSFVTITGGSSGSGSGSVSYAVASNPGSTARSVSIAVSGRAIEINQSATGSVLFGLTATASTSAPIVAVTWQSVPGAATYQLQRSLGGGAFSPVVTVPDLTYEDATVTSGLGYLYRVVARDASGSALTYSSIDLAVPFAYTDPNIVAGTTTIKAAHFTELRTVANAARSAAGLPPMTFTGAIAAGTTVLRAHLVELRTAVNAARSTLGLPAAVYTDASITVGVTPIRKAHIVDLRSAAQ